MVTNTRLTQQTVLVRKYAPKDEFQLTVNYYYYNSFLLGSVTHCARHLLYNCKAVDQDNTVTCWRQEEQGCGRSGRNPFVRQISLCILVSSKWLLTLVV